MVKDGKEDGEDGKEDDGNGKEDEDRKRKKWVRDCC